MNLLVKFFLVFLFNGELDQSSEIQLINLAINTPLYKCFLNFCSDENLNDEDYYKCEEDCFDFISYKIGYFSSLKQYSLIDDIIITKTWERLNICLEKSSEPETCFCGNGYHWCSEDLMSSISCCE